MPKEPLKKEVKHMLETVRKDLNSAKKKVLEFQAKNDKLLKKLKDVKIEPTDKQDVEVEDVMDGIIAFSKTERREFARLIRTTSLGHKVYSIIIYGG